MAKITLDGVEIDVAEGSPLVEVIKQQGTFISNLCYIDGIPPYAGCRTCLVEIEGARGLQLACTSRIAEGMEVRTQTAQVLEARQSVLSIINANHSDRCLTCHRRVHCQPGDICLRDDTVTHRCLTCAKNYRCELQTTNEMLEMANVEPWLGEERTYYESEPPEADRANPFLEFDPQMCIICTRCVRACDEIRHTGAVTLAGRGPTTMIAFGAGGAIHESNCDFCGACIDVCPTATLLEKPNKWIAKTEEWVPTTCNSCSVGCTLSMGVRNGKVVMVKPDRLNPVSDAQICVRGRFHYDAVATRERLTRHLVRQGEMLAHATYEGAIETAVAKLSNVIKTYGPESVGFLVAPWATNEEAYLTQHVARELVGSNNVDSTAGPIATPVEAALTNAFGAHQLASNLEDIASASVIVVIADDLESSHNVAALRVKDAVVNSGARLIVVSSRYGEVCDFIAPPPSGAIMPSPQRVHSAEPTGVWLRPEATGEAATVAALAARLNPNAPAATAPGVSDEQLEEAADILRGIGEGKLVVLFAPSSSSALLAGNGAAASANLAIAAKGSDAALSLHVLPTEANVTGIRDMNVRPVANGKGLTEMLSGGVKAMVIVGDNPMLLTPDKDAVEAGLRGLEALVVIDGLRSETAEFADVVFADLPSYGKDGTRTSADRRIGEVTRAEAATGDQRDSIATLNALAGALADGLGKQYNAPGETARELTQAIAANVEGYEGAGSLSSGRTRAAAKPASSSNFQPVEARNPQGATAGLLLTSSRGLYTSIEGATIRSEEADKLHREEFLEINPQDAGSLGVLQNRPVTIGNGTTEIVASAALTDAVKPGSVHLPAYFEGGIVNRLLSRDGSPVRVTIRPA